MKLAKPFHSRIAKLRLSVHLSVCLSVHYQNPLASKIVPKAYQPSRQSDIVPLSNNAPPLSFSES